VGACVGVDADETIASSTVSRCMRPLMGDIGVYCRGTGDLRNCPALALPAEVLCDDEHRHFPTVRVEANLGLGDNSTTRCWVTVVAAS